MAGVVCKCGIKREPGWLYFVDKRGNAARVTMTRAGKPYKKKVEVVQQCGIKRNEGYLYFVDKKGNVAEAKIVRGGHRKKR
jgi:hypothetical protein